MNPKMGGGTFKVIIKVLMMSSSHKHSNREVTKSVFHHFCSGLPVSLTFCRIRYIVWLCMWHA